MADPQVIDSITAPGDGVNPPTNYRLKANARTEYAVGGSVLWASASLRSLPYPFDDLMQDFGDDIYERMGYDADIASSTRLLKTAVMTDGVKLTPAVSDKLDPDYAFAAEITDACTRMLEDLDPSLDDTILAMLSAFELGNKMAEQVYAIREGGKWAGKLFLESLKVKNRRSTAFVVDRYLNVAGIAAVVPGVGQAILPTVLPPDGTLPANVLPRAKFAVLSHWPVDSDPRGTSVLRAAYTPWWGKMQLIAEHVRYLAQFASPSIIANTPEYAQDYTLVNPDGTPILGATGQPVTVRPEDEMMQSLLAFRNGTVIVLPFGAKADTLHQTGDGKAFTDAFRYFGNQIAKAVLNQESSTGDIARESDKDALAHGDALGQLIKRMKRAVARMLRRDVLRPFILYNWGIDALDFVPYATLGEVEPQDQAGMITALGTIGYKLSPSQLPAIDALANMPARSEEDLRNLETLMIALAPGTPGAPPAIKSGTGAGTPKPKKAATTTT